MVREARRIDSSTMPDLARLADEVARTRTPWVITHEGRDVAVISPLPSERRRPRRKGKTLTPAQIEAVLSTAGGWKGNVDVEQLKRDIKAARSDYRPPVQIH